MISRPIRADGGGPCIRITSSNVRLMGIGRPVSGSISGNATASGSMNIGVFVAPESPDGTAIGNVTVSNLLLEDWTTGILYANVRDGTIRNNVVTGSHIGIEVYGRNASDNSLVANTLTGNGRAVAIEWADGTRVLGNHASNNLDGVRLSESTDARVNGNVISANRRNGLELTSNSSSNRVQNNTLRKNTNAAIVTDDSSAENQISGNLVRGTGTTLPKFASNGVIGVTSARGGQSDGGSDSDQDSTPGKNSKKSDRTVQTGTGNLAPRLEGSDNRFSIASPDIAQILFADDNETSFNSSGLSIELNSPTSLQFGPDGRLYVSEQYGTIQVLTINRVNDTYYNVTDVETITAINDDIPNHDDDDGSLNESVQDRLVTGILVAGTAENPVLYVTSSDPRIGGGTGGDDTLVDTNSGVLSRLRWNGSAWNHTQLVRGLPRSEENHASNGMALDEENGTLYIAQGGNTNKGAPSNNFAYLPEYALSAAVLSVNLTTIGNSTYDIPTLKNTTEPFGGEEGANQAILTEDGPVQVYAPGFRNPYDVVLTQDNQLYTVDNGANSDWGGTPVNEGSDGKCTNEPNEDNSDTTQDALHYISGKGYYGGHPNPTRGNESEYPGAVPSTYDRPVECDFLQPGTEDDSLVKFSSSTNGIDEYTSSSFNGSLKEDLLAAGFDGNIWQVELNDSGSGVVSKTSLFSNFGSKPLDVTTQSDNETYNGTVWAATYGSQAITVFTPATNIKCLGADDPSLDEDEDGFSNADEIDNNFNPCSSASIPPDNDGDGVSDLNDFDDDNDGTSDLTDPFAVDANDGQQLPVDFQFKPGSYEGTLLELGFTGVMVNGVDDYQTLYDPSRLTAGGAANVLSLDAIPEGDAYKANNTQRYGFQVGVKPEGKRFTAHTTVKSPFPDDDGETPVDYQSQGFFIGTGDQDNYVKLVVSANGGNGGVHLAKEVDGSLESVAKPTDSNVSGSGQAIDLYMRVDPANDTVTAFYSVNGSENVTVDTTTFPGGWTADPEQGLALGVIATSRGPGDPFSGTWSRLEASKGTLSSGNQPPAAAFDYSPTSPETDEVITFNASKSSDVDGSIRSYEWDFDGDGTIDAAGEEVTYNYSTTGTKTVTLTVTDDNDATDTQSESIDITDSGSETLTSTEITSCGIINSSGTYTFSTDILNSSATPCLQVTASDVVIDGAGHTLDGAASTDGSAHKAVLVGQTKLEPETIRNVTVKNLTVTDWSTGLYYGKVSDGNIRDNVARGNIAGIQLFGDTANRNHTVAGNKITNATRGLAVEGTRNSEFVSNNVSGNYDGIYLADASGNTIRNNTVSRSTRRAVLLIKSGPDNEFSNVTVGGATVSFEGRNVSIGSVSSPPPEPADKDGIGK